MQKNSYMKMETTQISGVSSSIRTTNAKLEENAKLEINEKNQYKYKIRQAKILA